VRFAATAFAAFALMVPTAIAADATNLGLGYICGAEHFQPTAAPAQAVMLQGVGNETSPADTQNRQAQAWYDEGLNLYHAFDHEEAKVAFAKAASLDPACALCQWGVALSLGPTLNYAITPAQTAEALAAADKAASLVRKDDARAQGLIAALQLRYGRQTPDAQREVLYGHAMDALVERYPDDDQIANLTAHALLTPARHDDFSGVPRAEAILKTVLARRPDDTAAIHYYIHATEFADHAGQALPYAERLATLAPGASHLVHMAAHTLMHVGRYEQVAVIDAEALKVDADVKTELGYRGPLSDQRYYLHNYLFGLGGALMAGDSKLAVKYADHAAKAFPAAAAPDRRTTADARSLVAYGRFAPATALALAEQPDAPRFVRIYRHYARGEAFAIRGDVAGVAREAQAIDGLRLEAAKAIETNNSQVAEIAGAVLNGRAAMLSGHPARAATLFAHAAEVQEKAFPFARNFDPPPWWYPVRRSLAAADLKAGRNTEAAQQARASLADWPNDALALRVLSLAEARLGDAGAARAHRLQARRAWRGDLTRTPVDLT
jgi:tetratricopeptide (TPR) repeat protein